MITLVDEIENLLANRSEAEVIATIAELIKRITDRSGGTTLTIRDTDNRTLGVFVPKAVIDKPDLRDYNTLLAVTRYRIDNPPGRYLSVEEFIAEIMKDPT